MTMGNYNASSARERVTSSPEVANGDDRVERDVRVTSPHDDVTALAGAKKRSRKKRRSSSTRKSDEIGDYEEVATEQLDKGFSRFFRIRLLLAKFYARPALTIRSYFQARRMHSVTVT